MELKVRTEFRAGVAHVTLAAPRSGNALNPGLLRELNHALREATGHEACRVVVLGAEGASFCDGMDLEALDLEGPVDDEYLRSFLDCLMLIRSSSRPVIARVEGRVSGGGVGLVAACDLVLAAPDVVLMLPEVIVGMIPALIAPFLLRRISPARLQAMALGTCGVGATEAWHWGLVDEVAEDGMENALTRQIGRLFRSSPQALARTKAYLNKPHDEALHQQTRVALAELADWLRKPGVVADIRTFAEGLTPSWFQKYQPEVRKGDPDLES